MFVVLLLALTPARTEAKHFRNYPGVDEEAQKDSSNKKQDGAKKEAAGDTKKDAAGADEKKDGEEGDDKKDDDEKKDDDDGPPGLLGYALHGSDDLKLEYLYTGEVFTNMRGGKSTNDATRYLGLIDISLTADLAKMGFRPGGTFFMLAENSHGQGLTTDFVGDTQWLSNIDPGEPFTQVTEYWWERKLLDDKFTLRLGKQDPNAEFAVVDVAGDFVNSSFGYHRTMPMFTWPNTPAGVMTLLEVAKPVVLKFGIYDGAARTGTWGFSGTGETYSLYECETHWSVDCERLPGDAHIGMWYHSGEFASYLGEELQHSGNHGVYMSGEQMIWNETGNKEESQGLGIFFQYGWAPESVNDVARYFGTGLVYKGLIPGRDEDTTGLGLADAMFSRYLDRPPEQAVELFHKIHCSKYVALEPDLQYIANPSGLYRDAFVFGLRFEAKL